MCRVKISNEQKYHNQFNHQLAFSIFIWQCLIVWGLPPTPAVPHVLTQNRWTLNSSKNRLIERSSVTKFIVKPVSMILLYHKNKQVPFPYLQPISQSLGESQSFIITEGHKLEKLSSDKK